MNFKINFTIYLILFNCLFFAIVAYVMPIRFETNDDIGMLLIASGKYTGIPDAHLVYINIFYGFVISSLYRFCSNIEWYTYAFVVIHILSMTIISHFILIKNLSRNIKGVVLALFYLVEIYFIQNFQFTTTAAICTLAGLVLLERLDGKHLWYSVILVVLGTFIRFESAFLVLIIYSPVLLKETFLKRKIIVHKKQFYFLFAIIISLLFRYVDFISYHSTPQLKYYQECNKLLDVTIDNPNAYLIIDSLPKGILYDDYHLLMKFLIDPSVFTLPILEEIVHKNDSLSFSNKIVHIIPSLRMYSHYLFYILIISIICFIGTKSRAQKTIILLCMCMFFVLISFIALDGQIKYRVFISAVLPLLFIVFLENERNALPNKYLLIGGSCMVFLFCIELSKGMYSTKLKRIEEAKSFNEQEFLLHKYMVSSDDMILPFYDNFAMENSDPFHASSEINYRKFIFSGWFSFTPYNMSVFPSFKRLSEQTSFITTKNQQINMLKIQEVLKNRYNLKYHPTVMMESERCLIIKFIKTL